ncbi:uncharacterized protein LOC132257767 [Phlebotomus argentipes]|uniref:uncharacterized protein LOC132257767 n=1 Tax=Phlebotomus argentipes TaxID=94469 RepID=UPI00289370ED|nr:uncharacterized protein LOC132257767 [Phlebotomus argentipes]
MVSALVLLSFGVLRMIFASDQSVRWCGSFAADVILNFTGNIDKPDDGKCGNAYENRNRVYSDCGESCKFYLKQLYQEDEEERVCIRFCRPLDKKQCYCRHPFVRSCKGACVTAKECDDSKEEEKECPNGDE